MGSAVDAVGYINIHTINEHLHAVLVVRIKVQKASDSTVSNCIDLVNCYTWSPLTCTPESASFAPPALPEEPRVVV
jgi:hypothetical protein